MIIGVIVQICIVKIVETIWGDNMERLQIELNGRKLYWEDVCQFLEWFTYKMGKHTKITMDMLMDDRLVISDIDGVTDGIVSHVYTDMVGMKEENAKLLKSNHLLQDDLAIAADKLRKYRDNGVDILEDRLMSAERMLAKIGMSLNYKEKLVGTK